MEINKVSREFYECPICGYIYNTEEGAAECYKWGKFLRSINDIPKYHWLKFIYDNEEKNKTKGSVDKDWLFCATIELDKPYGRNDPSCKDTKLKFNQIGSNFEKAFYNNIVDIDFKSIQDMYKEHNLIPTIYYKEQFENLPHWVAANIAGCFVENYQKFMVILASKEKNDILSFIGDLVHIPPYMFEAYSDSSFENKRIYEFKKNLIDNIIMYGKFVPEQES